MTELEKRSIGPNPSGIDGHLPGRDRIRVIVTFHHLMDPLVIFFSAQVPHPRHG